MTDSEALLKAMEGTATVKPIPVTIPGWPEVYVKPLTVAEAEADTEVPKDKRSIARNSVRLICNKEGVRLLDASNEAHVDLLSKQPWAILQRILQAADFLNGDTKEAVDAMGKH